MSSWKYLYIPVVTDEEKGKYTILDEFSWGKIIKRTLIR